MAKFCKFCGKPLEEGARCTCQGQQTVSAQSEPQFAAAAAATPVQQAQQNPQAQQQVQQQYSYPQQAPVTPSQPQYTAQPTVPAAPNNFVLYLKRLWAVTTQIVKKPADMLHSFAAAGDYKVALGFMVVHALMFAFFMMAWIGKIGSSVDTLFQQIGLGSYGGYGSYAADNMLKFPMVRIFFLSLIFCFGMSCLFAAILLLFNKAVFKGETSYTKMLCVASAKSFAVTPFLVLGILFSFINVSWGFGIFSLGGILGYYFVYAALKGGCVLDKNKLLYSIFLSFAVFSIAEAILISLVYPLYLPDALRTALSAAKAFA